MMITILPWHPALLGNMGDINFEDSPVFSDNYYLAGCQIEAVRVLFTPELREHLAQQPHWSVQGDGKRLVLSRRNTVIAESEEAAFISDALQVVQLIREGEQCLDERPDLVRETTARALVDSTQNMSGVAGGMLGAMMKRVVEKTAISSDEMTTFLQSTTPRDIPNGMRVQVIGDNLALIVAGIAFACMGFASAIGTCFSQRATPNGWQPAPDCQ